MRLSKTKKKKHIDIHNYIICIINYLYSINNNNNNNTYSTFVDQILVTIDFKIIVLSKLFVIPRLR